MKKIFIGFATGPEHSIYYQTTIVYNYFHKNGYILVSQARDADIILLNGFPFNNFEEKKAILTINYYRKTYPMAGLYLFGSLPNMLSFSIPKDSNIICIGLSEYFRFDTIFQHSISINDILVDKIRYFIPLSIDKIYLEEFGYRNPESGSEYIFSNQALQVLGDVIFLKDSSTIYLDNISEYSGEYNYLEDLSGRFYIETTRGCGYNCTFCCIKNVSGHTKSFPLNGIIQEIQRGLNLGFRSIYIIDEDSGNYGIDIGLDFADLLNEINKISIPFKVYIYYFEPGSLQRLFQKINRSFLINRLKFLSVPIQTTSQRILTLMRRNYDITEVLNIIRAIKSLNSEVIINSTIMYGFPTETQEEFSDSFRILHYFDNTLYVCYSGKKGTYSSSHYIKLEFNELTKRVLFLKNIYNKFPERIDGGEISSEINSFLKRLKNLY